MYFLSFIRFSLYILLVLFSVIKFESAVLRVHNVYVVITNSYCKQNRYNW